PPLAAWPMYRAMVGVGVICGLSIVTVFELTRPVIERNRAAALERAIFDVLPGAATSRPFRLDGSNRLVVADGEADAGGPRIYAGYDAAGLLVGAAIETQGMGYQDVIRVLYGYSPEHAAVIGIRVLESKETPGLGDRIETDPEFLANFARLDARLTADGSAIAHPIEAVKHGRKDRQWQVDGITGATISSVAIADMLRRSTADWVPIIQRDLAALRGDG
ncbi:MAG TPA: FMN-binding protein, partial [Candidatus Polarisedimenticolaceae bacterium]|nr:FMN-binding protein [Candidatus Polarisedimenticolaceae bacterium]